MGSTEQKRYFDLGVVPPIGSVPLQTYHGSVQVASEDSFYLLVGGVVATGAYHSVAGRLTN